MSNIVDIIVQKNSEHPSIIELASSINEIVEDPINIEWENTRDEQHILRSFPKRKFILYVKDFPARDRVMNTLGLPLKIEQPLLERAKLVLRDPNAYDWRNFCADNAKGPSTKNVLIKLVADSLRKGNRPVLADIMQPLLFGGINVLDVDVLLRVKGK